MILVYIVRPDGVRQELSERVTAVGTLQDAFEGDELTELVHSDIDFSLDDRDGAMSDFFRDIAVGDEYSVEVWRDTGLRRPKMRLEFSGVLDLPWSLDYDDEGKAVTVQVFGQSKKLERADGENVKRSLEGRTATVVVSTTTVTPSVITDLLPGDEVTLRDSVAEETRTILSVGVSTFETTEAWDNGFTDAEMIVETPYYRNKTVAFLVAALFGEAGITDYSIEINQLTAGNPFGSRSTSDAADNWTQVNAATHADTDELGDVYTLDERVDTPVPNTHQLWVQKNGGDLVKIDEFTDTIGAGYEGYDIAYNPTDGKVWVTWREDESNTEELKYCNKDGTGVTLVAADFGTLRWTADGGVTMIPQDAPLTLRRFYGPFDTLTIPDGSHHNTLSVFDDGARAAMLYSIGAFSYARVWLLPSWTFEGDYLVSETTAGSTAADAYNTGMEQVWWGNIGTDYYLVSRMFGGVIPYADFDGLSVGAALRELAIVTGSFVSVDQHGIGLFAPRTHVLRDRAFEIADAPIDQTRLHLSELYRDSVRIEGTTLDDVDFEVVVGERGDPSRRLELDSPLIVEEPLAEAVGNLYLALLAVTRAERRVTMDEPTDPYRPLDRIMMDDGKTYDVLDVSTDLEDREQELRLIEVV